MKDVPGDIMTRFESPPIGVAPVEAPSFPLPWSNTTVKRTTLTLLAGLFLALGSSLVWGADDGWICLFDGKTFDGWKMAEENTDSWKIEDGLLVCQGDRCHLFYAGPELPFVNFEFEAEVMTAPGSNSGIYFHTEYQATGWPKQGYEVQVNNTHKDPVKTGSLYGVVKNFEAPAKDNEWFKETIIVQGKKVTIKVDGKTIVDYTEPENPQPEGGFNRVLSKGTFALQAHDPKSKVYFRNIKVKKLP